MPIKMSINGNSSFRYEALIMIIMYLLYIVLLYYNDKVQQFISNRLHLSKVSQNIEYAPLLVRQRSASLDLVDESDEEDIMESGDVNSNDSRIIIDEKLTNLGWFLLIDSKILSCRSRTRINVSF